MTTTETNGMTTTALTPAENDELTELGCLFTDEGVRLRRLPWMTDSQWELIVREFTAWWETYVESLVESRRTVQ